ncbi:MAG: peroxiredoxin-like family protein [Bradymonadia bacterium]
MNIDNFEVLTPDGTSTTLGEHREGRAGIMVFVRHFGCIFCRQRIAELVEQSQQFDDDDYAIWVVGNGTASMARDFVDTHRINCPVFTDPSRRVYRELGMKRKIGLNLKSVSRAISAFKDGHRQTQVQGDPWQQGGVVVFDNTGRVTLCVPDNEAGSEIPWHDVHANLTEPPHA